MSPQHHIHLATGIFTHANDTDASSLFPLHSIVLELTLELAEILTDTVIDSHSFTGKSPILFSAGQLFANVPIHSHAQFRDFLLNADFTAISKDTTTMPLMYPNMQSGLIFCTLNDLNAYMQTENFQQYFTSERTWDVVCAVESDEQCTQWSQHLVKILGPETAQQFHFCTQNQVRETWLQTIKKKYGLIELRIEGIPMKQQKTSDTTEDYMVPLLCRASSWHITQDIHNTTLKTLKFAWRRNDPSANIYAHNILSEAYPVVALQPNSNVSKCLMAFIAKGRAATVELIYDSQQASDIITHMITKQGNQAFIHVVSQSIMYDPQCSQNKKISDEYRSEQLFNLISQQNMIHYHPELTPFKNMSAHELKDRAKQEMTTMRHDGHLYQVPKYVEKMTRIFPLHFLRFTILWNEQVPSSVFQSLQPLFKIIYKDEPTEADIDQARLFLSDTYRACTSNEYYLFPHLKEDHKQRYYTHKKLWHEVRILLTAFRAERLLRIMDHLWPQFFFDPLEETQSAAPRQPNGLPALPYNEEGTNGFTVEALGTIVHDRPVFHDQFNIFPVGYRISKLHLDILDPSKVCKYIFSIQDGGDSPVFVIQRDQTSEHIFQAKTPGVVYTHFAHGIERMKGAPLSTMSEADGLKAFGLSNYTVQRLIAELPNAEKCLRPQWPFPHAMQREPNNFEPFVMRARPDQAKTLIGSVAPATATDGTSGKTPAQLDILNIGEPRKNASDNTNVSFALQTMFVYSHNRDLAVQHQKTELEQAINSMAWSEGMSLYDLHVARSEKQYETRTAILGAQKQLYSDMFANEDPVMDAIISQQEQLNSSRKKKNKKRKSQSESKRAAKRRRKLEGR